MSNNCHAYSLLQQMKVQPKSVSLIRSKNGIHLYRVETSDGFYVLKIFDNDDDRREIENYKLLGKLGVLTLPLVAYTDKAILLPDLEKCDRFRLGVESDLSDVNVAKALAKWYKKFHSAGTNIDLHGFYDEMDIISLQNINEVAQLPEIKNNRLRNELQDKFTEIRSKIAAMPHTLVYNDFYWTNFAVSRDGSSAMMFDFNLMGRGYAYGDVRNVLLSLQTEKTKQAFLDEYGLSNINPSEVIADNALAPLCFVLRPDRRWSALESFKKLNGGVEGSKLLENLQNWLKNEDYDQTQEKILKGLQFWS